MREREPRGRPKALLHDAAAVSEVLSNILLVAITVVAASSFGLVLSQIPAPAPTARTVMESFVLPTAPDRLVIEHRGGMVVPLRDLEVVIDVGGVTSRYNVGGRLADSDPKWSVVAPSGALKVEADRFQPGDQVRYQDAALLGQQVQASAYSQRHNVALAGPAPVLLADVSSPRLVSARTTSATTVEATMSEPLAAVTAADFTVAGATINAARLLREGATLELSTTALGTGATPAVSVVASPVGTRDFANRLVVGSTTVTASDGAAPTVSSVVATSTGSTIRVNFTTSESATPTIRFGPTMVYGLSVTGTAGTSHSLVLSPLTSGTTYHYIISATDSAGNAGTDVDRSLATTGSGGVGGSSGTSNYLDFTTAPSSINPGIVSGTITLTLKDSSGNPVNPSSALDVRLATNSSSGQFVAVASTTALTNVTMPTSASTVTFRYIDMRASGPSVLSAYAPGTVPGSHFTVVTRRGIVPTAGDAVASIQVNVAYIGEQDRDESPVHIGLSVVNPTPTARTVDRVSLTASPTLGGGTSSFFRSAVALGAGSDAAFTGCTLTGADSDTITCDPSDFVLSAYSMRQLVLSFRTSNSGSDAGTIVSGTVVLAAGAGSVSSPGVNVRHEGSNGQAAMARLLAESGAGGNERAGFPSGVTGGSAADFYFEWWHHEASVRVRTTFTIPAGWSSVSVPSQGGLAQMDVSIQQPTSTQPGYVHVTHDSPGAEAGRELFLRATPPSGAAIEYLRADSSFDTGSRTPVTASQAFPVVIA